MSSETYESNQGAGALDVAERVVALMFRRKLTRNEVAASIGKSKAAFYNKMNGTSDWSLTELRDLARVLGTSVSYLVGESEAADEKKNGLTRSESDRSELVAGAGFEPTTSGL